MYERKNHSKYNLKVHLVFVVKYRKNIINNEISDFIKLKISNLSKKSNFNIEMIETDNNHIHLLVAYDPKVSILQIVRKLKQETTYALWQNYDNFLKRYFWKERTFWSDGYFACSIGQGPSYQVIQQYIKNQG